MVISRMEKGVAAALVMGFFAVAGCWAGPAAAGGQKRQGTPREFLFGADFNPKASDNIKTLFYETGMNCIRMTGGGYSWAAEMHKKIADEFAVRGLKVYMQLGSHYPSADYFSFTDARLVDQDGQSGVEDQKAWAITYSGQNWPQYSYTSEQTRAKFAGDFKNYVDTFASNRNIAGVILHNEPGFFWLTDRVFDYNPVTVAKFRLWLETHYQTIHELNRKWNTAHATFAEITPPGKPPVQNIGAWLDWRRFSIGNIAGFMKWEAGLAATLRKDVPRTTNLDGPLNHWYGYRGADIHAFSTAMDTVGMDIYPTAWTGRAFVPYAMDMLMGVAQGREGHVLECEVFSERLWRNLSETQRARLLGAELWSCLGHGASCVLLWGFDREDAFNLTAGEFNERVLLCRDLAHYAKMIGLGRFSRSPSGVAVCVDPDAYLYLSGLEKKPHLDTPELDAENQGFHAALSQAGIQADVILTAQLRQGAATGYQALVLPAAMMMDAEMAGILRAYVLSGGTVVADAPLATMDRWGRPSDYAPNNGLDQLFGVRCGKQQDVTASAVITSARQKIPLSPPVENLVLLDARVLGTLGNGRPGLVSKSNGRGKAVFFTGRAGSAYLNHPEGNNLDEALTGLLASAFVHPFVERSPTAAKSLDCSFLMDAAGNMLLVAATQGAKGKMSAEVRDVKMRLPCTAPTDYRMAFILTPTRNEHGIVRSGPQPLKIAIDAKGVAISIGDVVSATPVLLVKNTTPLLAVEADSRLRCGQEGKINVTCHNPSAKKLDGSLRLHLPAGFSALGREAKISIEPYGQREVMLKFNVDSATPVSRAPIRVILTCSSVPEGVSSVPVDVRAE